MVKYNWEKLQDETFKCSRPDYRLFCEHTGQNPGWSTYHNAFKRLQQRKASEDEAIAQACFKLGIDPENVSSGWLKSKDASLHFVNPLAQHAPEDTAELIANALREVMADVPQLAPSSAVAECDDRMVMYILADVHLGMLASKGEAGKDYDSKIAKKRVLEAMKLQIAAMPRTKTAYLVLLGDFVHYGTRDHKSSRSGHIFDSDTRFPEMVERATKLLVETIEMARKAHPNLQVICIDGNHDELAMAWLRQMMFQLYENVEGVNVPWFESLEYAFSYGRNIIALHHGHDAKPVNIVGRINHETAHLVAQIWQEFQANPQRTIITGHFHNKAETTHPDGTSYIVAPPICSLDAYAASKAYPDTSGMMAIVFGKDGRQLTNTVTFDSMEIGQ